MFNSIATPGSKPWSPAPKCYNNGYWFDQKNRSGVYVITCLPLQKVYVGVSLDVRQRLTNNRSRLNRKVHECVELQKDYTFYGPDVFQFDKLLYGSGVTDLRELGLFETAILESIPSSQHYNKVKNWHSRYGDENSFYGKNHTDSSRSELRTARKSKPSFFKGKTQSAEVKAQISEQNKGMTSKERRKPLYIKPLYINSVYYESVSQASVKTGYARRIIREKCHSTRPQDDNFRWA